MAGAFRSGWLCAAVLIGCLPLTACNDEETAKSAAEVAEISPAAGTTGHQDAAGSEKDKVVDIVIAEANTACLRELPPPSVDAGSARISLSLENFSYSFEEGRHRFTHDRRFKETAGIGLYIYRGKVCVEDATVCADACVRYRVDPGGSLTQRGHHFATPTDPDRITLQYWARDDAGNTMTFRQEIRTAGETAEVVGN